MHLGESEIFLLCSGVRFQVLYLLRRIVICSILKMYQAISPEDCYALTHANVGNRKPTKVIICDLDRKGCAHLFWSQICVLISATINTLHCHGVSIESRSASSQGNQTADWVPAAVNSPISAEDLAAPDHLAAPGHLAAPAFMPVRWSADLIAGKQLNG